MYFLCLKYTPQNKFCTDYTIFTSLPKFCKLLGKLIIFIKLLFDKTLK